MRRSAFLPALLFAIALPIAVSAASPADTALVVGGDVDHPYVLSAAEFAALPHTSLRAEGHDTKRSTFDGVLLSELLLRAGVALGGELRGARVAQAVVVSAADGYRAVFAIAEIDSGFSRRTILVSDRRDGAPTVTSEGPLRIVAEGDQRFARWVRQVRSITVRKL
jgi:hypothetical protein